MDAAFGPAAGSRGRRHGGTLRHNDDVSERRSLRGRSLGLRQVRANCSADAGACSLTCARRHHRHVQQQSVREFTGSTASLEDFVASRKQHDAGILVLASLLGCEHELVTFVDG